MNETLYRAMDDADRALDQCFDAARHHRGKLYGRDHEKEMILQAYRRIQNPKTEHGTASSSLLSKTELILIAGPTGIGKTGLAESIRSQAESIDEATL